jgi:ectoine utilization protein EutC
MNREVLVLREPQVRALLDPAACIQAVENAFTAYATGKAELPAVINLDVPEHGGEVHVKTGHLRGGAYYAVKIASGFPGNLPLGLQAHDGMVLVFDAKTGAPAAFLLDNGFITDLRTAAAGAVAAKHLARKQVNTLAVVGSGLQARYQVRLVSLVRNFQHVRVWGRNRSKAEDCVKDLSAAGLPGSPKLSVADSLEQAVNKADVVITVTASRAPLIQAEWLSPGTLVIAVGSDGPDKQELDVNVLTRADRIVADSLPQCLRLGEINHAMAQGVISKKKISVELGEITAGLKPGRSSDGELIVCDLTGIGVQDVAAASLVMQRALASGVGDRLPL